ncbi:hypothetical protein L1887_58950 [Cichorium endivia]|nr:hypothetical protein L1887_58950 [Cichorium endivia]
MSSARNRPAEAGLGSKKRGIAPLPIHGISKITFKSSGISLSPEGSHLYYTSQVISQSRTRVKLNRGLLSPLILPSPFPWLWFRWISDSPCPVPVLSWLFDARGRPPKEPFPVRPPAGTRRPALAAEAARAVRRQPTGSGLGPPCPALRAILFPRLRIHFADFPCLHCSIDQRLFTWRPDAVMSTTGRGRHSVLRIFKGRRGRTGHRATCGALPAAGPYLRLSRFQGWAGC